MSEISRIVVVGLGYVGLPTSLAFHDAGFSVHGIDINESVIRKLSSGVSHLSDSSEELEIPVDSETWSVGSSFSEAIPEADVVLISVPTPTTSGKEPDLSFVSGAFKSVLSNLRKGRCPIMVLESTVFPGITNSISARLSGELGIKCGEDFELAYSPERVSPGEVGKSASNVARIVGSNDPEIGEKMADIYSMITAGGCTYVGSIEVAEAAKMVENTQRDIDLAFTNELAKVLPEMGIDVEEVLDAAATKWNFHRHKPGIGVGGHCIPVDPYYYMQFSREVGIPSIISPAARELNESMPRHSAEIILSSIPVGGNILVLGMAYKPNVGDFRETPVFPMVEHLISKGSRVYIWDPYISDDSKTPIKAITIEDPFEKSLDVDCVVLATAHEECLSLGWSKLLECISGNMLYDGPRVLDSKKMTEIGWRYSGVGFPK